MGSWPLAGTVLLVVAPWIVLSPLGVRGIRRRTIAALETLLRNAAAGSYTAASKV